MDPEPRSLDEPAAGRAHLPALLEATDLELATPSGSIRKDGALVVTGPSLVCIGRAEALLQALVKPAWRKSGSIRLLGSEPSALLETGRAGYCPRVLPLPGDFRVEEALRHSARLVVGRAVDVRGALERVGIGKLRRRKLSSLSELEQRLLGLAHGLTSSPELLLAEDLLTGLADPAAQHLALLLEREIEGRSFVLAASGDRPSSRRLAELAEQALRVDAGLLLGPSETTALPRASIWARFDRVVPELCSALEARGGRVVRGPSAQVLWISGLPGPASAENTVENTAGIVAEVARAAGVTLEELEPTGLG